MAFKLQVLDTADSANIQRLGPDCTYAIKYCRADSAAHFLLVGMLVIVFLSIDSARMKRKQTSLKLHSWLRKSVKVRPFISIEKIVCVFMFLFC